MSLNPTQEVAIEQASNVADADRRHFEFGRNWARFLARLDDGRIAAAGKSLLELLHRESLAGVRFLDAGCGSGLFSLAANRLGAQVSSFDFDPNSVACALHLRSQEAGSAISWNVTQGSLLDDAFMSERGRFDVVYCWGVAHHTGAMWQALENLAACVAEQGQLVVALYNDQGYVSRGWRLVKSVYQRLPRWLKPIYVALVGLYWPLARVIPTVAACGLRLITLRNPFQPLLNWLREIRHPLQEQRGMDPWTDLVDWVGGWPFEVARPEEVFRFFRDRGFMLEEMTTCSGHGCNEFVFRRVRNCSNSETARSGV